MNRKKLQLVPQKHKTKPELLQGRVNVALIGCGGNGSQMLTKLARLHFALCETGHPGGLMVYAFDHDKVTRANVGRQMFSPSDVGLHKAVVCVNRINNFYGLGWQARAETWREGIWEEGVMGHGWRSSQNVHLIVSCVDTARARRSIEKSFSESFTARPEYWLDMGNGRDTGQVILGQPENAGMGRAATSMGKPERKQPRLPTVMDVFPELRSARFKESDAPSCSVADSLQKQSLFVNDHMAAWAAQMLDNLLRVGEIEHHGAYINLESGHVVPVRVPKEEQAAQPQQRRKAVAA